MVNWPPTIALCEDSHLAPGQNPRSVQQTSHPSNCHMTTHTTANRLPPEPLNYQKQQQQKKQQQQQQQQQQ